MRFKETFTQDDLRTILPSKIALVVARIEIGRDAKSTNFMILECSQEYVRI